MTNQYPQQGGGQFGGQPGQPPYGQPQPGQPQFRQPQYGQPQYGYQQYGQPQGQQFGGQPQQGGTPGKQGGRKLLLPIILGVIGVVVIGVVIGLMGSGKKSVATPTNPVTVSTPTAPDPTEEPTSADPTDEPTDASTSEASSAEPTEETTDEPAGGEVMAFKSGITATVPDGWKIAKRDAAKDLYILQAADGSLLGLQTYAPGGVDAAAEVKAYLARQAESLENVQSSEVTVHELNPKLSVAEGAIAGVDASSGGSDTLVIDTVVAIRKADKVAFSATLVAGSVEDVQTNSEDFSTVVGQALSSMI